MIIVALAAVGLAIWLAGLLAGMAIARAPEEDEEPDWRATDVWASPALHVVEPPPFDPDPDLIGHIEKEQRPFDQDA